MSTTTLSSVRLAATDRFETLAFCLMLAFVAATQFSIAVAEILLTLTVGCWLALVVGRQERFEAPPILLPLAVYAGWTLVSAAFSPMPRHSFLDAKEVVLFIIVPIVYRLARGPRAFTTSNVILTLGAVSALVGILQYGVLQFDNLGRRPQGTLSHYMTYSGGLMLVAVAAGGRLLYRRTDRAWPALVMPALLVALALTFTRSAWVGTCAGVALLLILKDYRLLGLLPIVAAVFISLAPGRVTDRVYSMFDLNDPTSRDRVAMLRYGVAMVRDHPLTGVGPDMVQELYPRYRDAQAVVPINPHLHNVPMQIAAERGLPALAVWLWFIVRLVVDAFRRWRSSPHPEFAATALASVAAMLAAGQFEYNFGDSEFLMLFLVLVTLPYAADRSEEPARS